MDDADFDGLIVSALNALASSPNGTMTLGDLGSHLEVRHGSTDPAAAGAQSSESRSFRQVVAAMLSPDDAASLVARGLATTDGTGALISITPAGRDFIGR